MAADDNGPRAYKQSRRFETQDNLQSLLDADLAEAEALAELEEAPEPVQDTAESTPQTPQDPSGEAQAEAGTEAPEDDTSIPADILASLGRAGPAYLANVADNIAGTVSEAVDYLGLPMHLLSVGSGSGRAQQGALGGTPTSFRDKFDEVAGTPQTMAGQFVQDAGGELIALVPLLRSLKIVGALRAGGQIMTADFLVTAAGSRKGQNTALGSLADMAGFDGVIRDAISNKADDSTAERMLRSGLEGVALGKTFDVLLDKGMKTVRWARNSAARRSTAAAEDIVVPGQADAAANDIHAIRSEQEGLIAVRENLDEIETMAKELKEFGGGPETSPESQAFLRSIVEAVDGKLAANDAKIGAREVVDLEKQVDTLTQARDIQSLADGSTPEARAFSKSIADGIDNRLAQVENELAQANAALEQSLRDSPETPGELIEAMRQDLKNTGTLDPKTDAALGKMADERIARDGSRVAPTKYAEVGDNHLRLKERDIARFRTAVTDGDFSAVTDIIAENFDSTNFDRIVDSENGIEQMMTGLLNEFGGSPHTLREMSRQAHSETLKGAEGALDEIARETGQNADAIAARLGNQLPGHELPAIMTAYRMFEVGLVKKVAGISDQLAEGVTDEALADFTRYSILLANVNDKRAGVASILGRSLNAQKIAVVGANLDPLLDAGRILRAEQRREIIGGAGGESNILALAEAVRLAPTAKGKRLLIQSAADGVTGTIGDINYAYVATNLLTAPSTHTTNLLGPLAKVLVWDPTIGIGGAAMNDTLRTVFGKDLPASTFRREVHFAMAKWRGLASLIGLDYGVRQASTLRAGVRNATMTGRRVTVPDGSAKFLSPGEGNAMRALEMSRTIKAGAPLHVPFSTFFNKTLRGEAHGGIRMKTLPQFMAKGLGNALEASADGSYRVFGKPTGDPAKDIGMIYGPAARGIDYLSRVMSWPRHVIAGGDELVAGISAHAKLEADSFFEARVKGLTGDDFIDFTNDIRDNAFNYTKIAETLDPGDLDQVARVEMLGRMADSASDYVREATFTQTPGITTKHLLEAQRYFPALRWFTFFARTGANIGRVAFNESIAGAAVQGARGIANRDSEQFAMATAKAAVNAGLMYKAYDLYSNGDFTGSGPLNPAARALWLEEHEPYSVWWKDETHPKGGQWVSYARLDPFATPLQVMAELMDSFTYMEDDDALEWTGRLSQRMGRLIESKSFLQGISDLMGIATGQGGFEDAGISLAKNVVPQSSLLRSYARAGGDTSKKLKDAGEGFELDNTGQPVPRRQGLVAEFAGESASGLVDSFVTQLQSGLPVDEINGWTEMLNELIDLRMEREQYPQRNLAGEVITYPPTMGPQMLFAMAAVPKDRENPVIKELLAEGVHFDLGTVFKTSFGVELSPKQQDFAHQYFSNPPGGGSKNIIDFLQDVIDSSKYQDDLSTNTKIYGSGQESGRKALLQKALNARLQAARKATLKEFPAVEAQRKKQLQEKNDALFQDNQDEVRQKTDERKSTLMKALDAL